MTDALTTAKERTDIPTAWRALAIPGEPRVGRSIRSPFRPDRHPSFSIFDQGRAWYDFGSNDGGDVVTFVQRALGLPIREAIRKVIEISGGSRSDSPKVVAYQPAPAASIGAWNGRRKPELPPLSLGTEWHLRTLSEMRQIPIIALDQAQRRGLLWFGDWHGQSCWFITDSTRANAQARRLDGNTWANGVKALTIPGSWAKWPIGLGTAGQSVMLVEGGPDLLAAHELALRMGMPFLPVAMFGAALDIHPSAVPLFRGRSVICIPHNDDPGRKACERWIVQIKPYVKEAWIEPIPGGSKDINDWMISWKP